MQSSYDNVVMTLYDESKRKIIKCAYFFMDLLNALNKCSISYCFFPFHLVFCDLFACTCFIFVMWHTVCPAIVSVSSCLSALLR